MSMDEGSPIWALIVYQASLDDEFDIDSWDDTSNRGPKSIEELVKMQLEPNPGQCTRLIKDPTSHEH